MLLWWQWALVFSAAFLVGVAKTGVTGLGILAVAIAASAIPARESVGAMLLTLIGGDIFAVLFYRRSADWSHLWRLFPWAAAGVIGGAATLYFWRIDDSGARRLIGGILLALVLADWARRFAQRDRPDNIPQALNGLLAGDPAGIPQALNSPQAGSPAGIPQALNSRLAGGLTGVLAGFTTMIANAAGPVMTLYLLAAGLPKLAFLGTSAWFFLALNLFKIPFSIGLGMITPTSAVISLSMLPFIILGAVTGRWLVRYIDEKRFIQIALALTAVASLRLLF